MKLFIDNLCGLFFLAALTFLIWEQSQEYIRRRQSVKGADTAGGVLFGCVCIFAAICIFPRPALTPLIHPFFIVMQMDFAILILAIAFVYFREAMTQRVYKQPEPSNLVLLKRDETHPRPPGAPSWGPT